MRSSVFNGVDFRVLTRAKVAKGSALFVVSTTAVVLGTAGEAIQPGAYGDFATMLET